MNAKDVNDIMSIESVSFGTHHWTPDAFKSEIKSNGSNYVVIIDDENSKVIGYYGFWLILEEAHVTTIAVHPEYRGKNLGELLLQHLIEKAFAKTAKWITLEVRISNIPAQNLYYKYGFQSLGLRRKYYQDNDEDALIMWTEDINNSKYQELLKTLKSDLENKMSTPIRYLKG